MYKRQVVGLVVGALGAAALVGCVTASETSSAASLLGLGVLLTLVATVIAGPLLVRPVIRVLGGAFPALFGSIGRMSQRNALRNPRRTGATAAALMVGLALVGGMSVASASMTKSFDEQIDKTLGADFVVQNTNFVPFPREITEKIRDTEGVGLVVRSRLCLYVYKRQRTRKAIRPRRWPRAAWPWTGTSPRTTGCASAARSPSSSRAGAPPS